MTLARNRVNLVGELFTHDGLLVEVGVHRGRFARQLLDACEPRLLWLVDAWRVIGEYRRDRTPDYEACVESVGHLPHVQLVRMLSVEAAALFADGALDGCYIDADHTRAGISADLEAWWPKVKSGGALAGHDYTLGYSYIDVIPAVDAFVEREGLELLLSGEPAVKSWAVRKP